MVFYFEIRARLKKGDKGEKGEKGDSIEIRSPLISLTKKRRQQLQCQCYLLYLVNLFLKGDAWNMDNYNLQKPILDLVLRSS